MKGLLFLEILSLFGPVFMQEVSEQKQSVNSTRRGSKVLPIFQVVRFPNDVCEGTALNGTCYTAEECSSKGGVNQGSCASGFGVCCSFSLGCGSTNSENNSYLVKSSFTSLTTNPCTSKVCPCSKDICRIRYDFSTFVLAKPSVATAGAEATVPSSYPVGGGQSYGQCMTDSFSINSPGANGSPVLCGTNSGYHMIIDSNGADCQEANFNIGTATTSTRSWSIRVTQYTCAQLDESGPPGCLQYYTQVQNTIETYNFPTGFTSATTGVSTTATHLANQHYDICIRRGSGYCYICYTPLNSGTNPTSFGVGLSITIATAAQGGQDTDCTTDYIEIPSVTTEAIAKAQIGLSTLANAASVQGRICGRFLTITDVGTAHKTVCSNTMPFRVGVHFDDMDICTANAASITCEYDQLPSGTQGFKLVYWQSSC